MRKESYVNTVPAYDMNHIEIILNLDSKKEFCFYSSVEETETFGIAIFWIGGKNCMVKNEKCIFPESRYVNSKLEWKNIFINVSFWGV